MFLAHSKMICARSLQSLTIIRIRKSTNKVLYLCLAVLLGRTSNLYHRVKYIAKFVKSNIVMIFFSCSILLSIDTVVIRVFIQSNICLALKLETIHLHDKSRHCEVLVVWFNLSHFV